jgi:iron complex outermembrane receptor protein
MSSTPATAIQRRRALLLASTFLIPALWLGVSDRACATNRIADQLPPIEVNPPGDANRTRAKPPPTRLRPRAASCLAHLRGPSPSAVPAPGPAADSFSTGVGAVRQFNGIVGTSTAVITAQDIARSPAYTVQEIIAQTPGVQLTSLFGGVNGARTTVDLRGFGAFRLLQHPAPHQWTQGE